MKIAHNMMVSMHYILTSDEGSIIDSSEGKEPLDYVQGHGMIVPGLEKAMVGHEPGETFKVKVIPSEGYGERDEAMVREFPSNIFQCEGPVQAGMTFYAETPNGAVPLTVKSVNGDKVTVDLNHELAGKNLNFEIKVVDVRVLTEEELEKMSGGCDCGEEGCGCGGEHHHHKENCDGKGGCGCEHHAEHHHEG